MTKSSLSSSIDSSSAGLDFEGQTEEIHLVGYELAKNTLGGE